MASITKKELIASIAERVDVPKNHVDDVLTALATVMGEKLQAGDEISLQNIGKFTVKERAAGVARNPRTGEAIEVPAKKVVKFKVSKPLADTLA